MKDGALVDGVGSAETADPQDQPTPAPAAALDVLAQNNRAAHYECVLVLMRGPGDLHPLIAQAEWHGEITRAPRGSGGFGYDACFYLKALDKTAAELDPAEKNRISHRGLALQKLLTLLKSQ